VGLIGVRTHANSAYLQALAEGGIPLFLATLWTAVAAVRSLWPRAGATPLLAGIAAASLALGLHQIFDCLTFFPKVGTYWWVLLGIGIATLPQQTLTSERR
jgi:O-antigen ligase